MKMKKSLQLIVTTHSLHWQGDRYIQINDKVEKIQESWIKITKLTV